MGLKVPFVPNDIEYNYLKSLVANGYVDGSSYGQLVDTDLLFDHLSSVNKETMKDAIVELLDQYTRNGELGTLGNLKDALSITADKSDKLEEMRKDQQLFDMLKLSGEMRKFDKVVTTSNANRHIKYIKDAFEKGAQYIDSRPIYFERLVACIPSFFEAYQTISTLGTDQVAGQQQAYIEAFSRYIDKPFSLESPSEWQKSMNSWLMQDTRYDSSALYEERDYPAFIDGAPYRFNGNQMTDKEIKEELKDWYADEIYGLDGWTEHIINEF